MEKPEVASVLPGPPAVMEFFDVLRVLGKTLAQNDSSGRIRSGVAERGVVLNFDTFLLEGLRYMITVDQLRPT